MYVAFSEDILDWLEVETLRLRAEGGPKQKLLESCSDFLNAFLLDFDAAQSAIFQAIALAEASSELSWCIFLRHSQVIFWLYHNQLQLALPASLSLLSLLGEERFLSSPLFPCACHDISSCYLLLDPAGYYKEIMANSQEVLTSVSLPHVAAVSAYRHMLLASACSNHIRETERWLALLQSFEVFSLDFALVYERLERWPEAKSAYLKVLKQVSSESPHSHSHLLSLLGAARVCCALYEPSEAMRLLTLALPIFAASSHLCLLARLFEAQAYLALVCQYAERAISFLTQAAYLYLEFSWYRDSALCGLQAAELARSMHLFIPRQALSFASEAARMLPPASQDILQRLASFSCSSLPASSDVLLASQPVSWRQLEDRNLAMLKTSLRVSIASGYLPLISRFLFLLAQLYLEQHRDFSCVVQYLIWHLALEHFHASLHSLHSSLAFLVMLRNKYEQKSLIEGLLTLAASPPPDWLPELCEGLSLDVWYTFIHSLLDFLTTQSLSSLSQEVSRNEQCTVVPFSS
jgi:tetratricopeptide (TPR) repeat protein